jgi:hypothetical protein
MSKRAPAALGYPTLTVYTMFNLIVDQDEVDENEGGEEGEGRTTLKPSEARKDLID